MTSHRQGRHISSAQDENAVGENKPSFLLEASGDGRSMAENHGISLSKRLVKFDKITKDSLHLLQIPLKS